MNIRRKTLPEQDFYDIVTALRGPDNIRANGASAAKFMTTAVIRHLVKMPPRGTVTSPEDARSSWGVYTDTKKETVREFMRSNLHYRNHVISAFDTMTIRSKIAREYRSFLRKESII